MFCLRAHAPVRRWGGLTALDDRLEFCSRRAARFNNVLLARRTLRSSGPELIEMEPLLR